jgi:hypothetical protein
MNERIRIIALECGAWHQVYDQERFMIDKNFDIEKFAQRIIDTSASIADAPAPYVGCGYITTTAGDRIREYFGVENKQG